MRAFKNVKWTLLLSMIWSAELMFGTANELTTAKFVNCTTVNATNECPPNSICSNIGSNISSGNNGNELLAKSNAYRCQCQANYVINPKFNVIETSNNSNASNETNATNNQPTYCRMVNATANNRIYVRQPAKVENLAFGILLVMFAVLGAVVLLYLVKVSRPLKRSKAAYTRLKRRREQRQRLEEFNDDDICMIQLNENRN